MIVDGLRPSVKSAILVQTVPAPLDPLFGSFDRVQPGSPYAMVETLNRKIIDWAHEGRVTLVDVARLATAIGLQTWHEPGYWHSSKLAFSPRLIPVYSDVVARTVAAVIGKSKKCLVLDLDNTLWGGVIADDGLEGIELGHGSPAGEAFVAIQAMALELRSRGVILAVCSKNEEDVARSPFREHPDMLLREDHIAVFQANWIDKAANLKAIASALNIGVDALVLLDDNPAERMLVRATLPLVGTPNCLTIRRSTHARSPRRAILRLSHSPRTIDAEPNISGGRRARRYALVERRSARLSGLSRHGLLDRPSGPAVPFAGRAVNQ